MAAHRYWRLRFTATLNNQTVWLEEVSFRGAGDTDLSVGGTASSSTFWGAGYEADKAFDKTDTTNGWQSSNTSFPVWIAYDHGTPVDVLGVTLQVPNTGLPLNSQPLADHTFFDWSDDGATWHPYGSKSVLVSGDLLSMGSVARFEPLLTPQTFRSVERPRSQLLAPNGLSQQLFSRYLGSTQIRCDLLDRGDFKVVGYTRKKALPTNLDVYRRVFLMCMQQQRTIRDTWSDPETGYYEFLGVRQGRYMVISYDHTLEQNGVIATDVPVEPM